MSFGMKRNRGYPAMVVGWYNKRRNFIGPAIPTAAWAEKRFAEGASSAQIAAELGVSKSMVSFVKCRAKSRGGWEDRIGIGWRTR